MLAAAAAVACGAGSCPLATSAGLAYGGAGTMSTDDLLGRGRMAFDRMAWKDSLEALTAADRAAPLEWGDLERLAMAGYLLRRDEAAADVLARVHHEALRDGDDVRAARAAFWLGFALVSGGEFARGGGWLSRAEHLLEGRPETVEHGYLLLPAAIGSLEAGDWSTAQRHIRASWRVRRAL